MGMLVWVWSCGVAMSQRVIDACRKGIWRNFLEGLRIFDRESPQKFDWKRKVLQFPWFIRIIVVGMRHSTGGCNLMSLIFCSCFRLILRVFCFFVDNQKMGIKGSDFSFVSLVVFLLG